MQIVSVFFHKSFIFGKDTIFAVKSKEGLFPLLRILPLHNLKRVPGHFLEQLCDNP